MKNFFTIMVSVVLCAGLMAPSPAIAGKKITVPTTHTADLIFQSLCSGGGTKGILDVNFPVQISWRCSKCGKTTQVTVPLVKSDNTDTVAKKMAGAINSAMKGSGNVGIKYYQSSKTKKQDQNWYRFRFTGVDRIDAGAWHSKLMLNVITWPGVRQIRSGPLPENVTPGKPGRTYKPGKNLKGNNKKKKYTGPGFFGWKEVSLSIGLHPWSNPGPIGSFAPYYSYRIPSAESDPDGLLFDNIQAMLIADGFEVEKFGEVELAILSGPNGTIPVTLLFGTCLNDPVEEYIEQEEHWVVGDIVSNTDEEPVEMSEEMESWLSDEIESGINEDLSIIAEEIAVREGLIPWDEYPELLAQDAYHPGVGEVKCVDFVWPE